MTQPYTADDFYKSMMMRDVVLVVCKRGHFHEKHKNQYEECHNCVKISPGSVGWRRLSRAQRKIRKEKQLKMRLLKPVINEAVLAAWNMGGFGAVIEMYPPKNWTPRAFSKLTAP